MKQRTLNDLPDTERDVYSSHGMLGVWEILIDRYTIIPSYEGFTHQFEGNPHTEDAEKFAEQANGLGLTN